MMRMDIAALFLWLAGAGSAALADEWAPADSGREGLFAITYRGKDMLPGEQATVFYTGTKTEMVNDSGVLWPTSVSNISFQIVLTSGAEPLTGFEGVSLRKELGGEDLVTFYSTPSYDDSYAWLLRPPCGNYTLAHLPNGDEAQCVNLCYRAYDDLVAQRNDIACDSGEAHWILIAVAGALTERQKLAPAGPGATETRKFMEEIQRQDEEKAARNGWLSFDEEIATANFLIVHTKWKGAIGALFQIDDTFRKAVWSPE